MNNSGYSANDILSMQKDAIRRVREMQKRANVHLQPEKPKPPEKPVRSQTTDSAGGLDILKSLGIDSERAMILLLAALLSHEGADQKLIFALLYLIM